MREREKTTMKPHHVWEESYEAAMLETDDKKLPNLFRQQRPQLTPDSTNCSLIMEVRPKNGKLSPMRLLG